MKKNLLSIALLSALLTTQARAVGFVATPVTTGTGITGYCYSLGMVATPQNLSTLSTNVSNGITDLASVLKAGQLEQIAAEKNLLNQQLQALSDTYRKLAAAQSKQQYLDETSGTNALDSNCVDQVQASSTSIGIADANSFAKMSNKASPITGQVPVTCTGTNCKVQYKESSPPPADQIAPVSNVDQAIMALATTPPPQWVAGTLTDPAASDDDIKAAIAHSVAPMPRRGIPDALLNSNAGLNWNAAAQIDRVQTTLAIDTLTQVAKDHRPTIAGPGAQNTWSQSGLPGTVPGMVNGKISPADFFSTLTQGWYNSPMFSANIKVKDDTWQIKQVALMMAAKLWARQRENDLLERAVAIQAAELAHRTQADVDRVNQARANAVDQSIRSQVK